VVGIQSPRRSGRCRISHTTKQKFDPSLRISSIPGQRAAAIFTRASSGSSPSGTQSRRGGPCFKLYDRKWGVKRRSRRSLRPSERDYLGQHGPRTRLRRRAAWAGEPTRIDVEALERRLQSPEFAQVAQSLRQIGFDSAWRCSHLRRSGLRVGAVAQRRQINPTTTGLQFWRIRMERRSTRNLSGMLALRHFPDDLFVGSPAQLGALRAAIVADAQ